VVFKKDALPYSSLVDFFFRMHDPTTANRQGNDVGTQYRFFSIPTSFMA